VKALGLDENTLVMFTSDNGATFGGSTGGLRGMKGSTYEGGYRVPCIARWPGKIPAGRVGAQPAVMMDLFSTALAATRTAPPKDVLLDGRDILPLFTSDAPSPHSAILGHQGTKLATIRDARWKLHVLKPGGGLAGLNKPGQRYIDPRGPDGVTILAPYEQAQPSEHPGTQTGDAPKPMQLFDLQNDPAEQNDVAAAHPDHVQRLKALFDTVNKDVPEVEVVKRAPLK
jgi:arylsulfatase A-like enzyme